MVSFVARPPLEGDAGSLAVHLKRVTRSDLDPLPRSV